MLPHGPLPDHCYCTEKHNHILTDTCSEPDDSMWEKYIHIKVYIWKIEVLTIRLWITCHMFSTMGTY